MNGNNNMSSSTLMVRLVPLPGRNPYDSRRSEIILDGRVKVDENGRMTSARSITIGRGRSTGITDPSLSRQVFRLSFDDAQQVWASLCNGPDPSSSSTSTCDDDNIMYNPCNNMPYINGLPWEDDQPNVQLTQGDIVSLKQNRYAYRVEIVPTSSFQCEGTKKRKITSLDDTLQSQETTQSSKGPSSHTTTSSDPVTLSSTTNAATATTGITIPKEAVSSLSDDIQCSICLDIQVHPRTLYPCGHSFCGSCLPTLQLCPQCRQTVTSHVPAVQLESLIATLVGIPNLLESNDVEHYHKRKSSLAAAAAVASSKKVRTNAELHLPVLGGVVLRLPCTVGTRSTYAMKMDLFSHQHIRKNTRSSPTRTLSCSGQPPVPTILLWDVVLPHDILPFIMWSPLQVRMDYRYQQDTHPPPSTGTMLVH